MTERIDHVAQAVHVLGNFPHEHIADSETALAWAQVHATLALVEQQRIANLIALSVPQYTISGAQVSVPSWDTDMQIRPEIREGLGLS